MRPRPARRGVGLVLLGALVAVPLGYLMARPRPVVSRPMAGPTAFRMPAVDVRYGFDAGVAGTVFDDRRLLPLHVLSAAGGSLSTVEHGDGLAVRFPPPCARYAAADCPRVILESGPAGMLNPGTGRLRYGAAIRMAATNTTEGANVLQKGYSVGDSQFKLQIDGVAGYPSCVMVGTGSAHIYIVIASVTVANGQWHSVECMRADGSLTVSVDGQVRGEVSLPTTLSVYNSDPLRIGGKGCSPDNDQFTGVVDDAYVQVG